MKCDLSVVIPARNEADNLRVLLPSLHRIIQGLGISYEIIVVDGHSVDDSAAVVVQAGCRLVRQTGPGYGGALREGFQAASGEYVLTMDADLSHEPAFVSKLWRSRQRADVLIASRYVHGGVAYMPLFRKLLSRILNRVFTLGLSISVRDISSGYRLYKTAALRSIEFVGTDFDALPEILIRCHAAGWQVLEVPFTYFPRQEGSSQARIIRVGINLSKTFVRMWKLRNSIEAADYDELAFYSRVPLQRWWQRSRHHIITSFARRSGRTLDIGCGSSMILQSLNDVIGLDIKHSKMRYMSRYQIPVLTGTLFELPFPEHSMDCVICSQVIEHVPVDPVIFTEFDRVLRPGGLLILGTPDYGTWTWPTIEWLYRRVAPGAYGDEHISHYTREGLEVLMGRMHYSIEGVKYVGGSELVIAARKGDLPVRAEEIEACLPTGIRRGVRVAQRAQSADTAAAVSQKA